MLTGGLSYICLLCLLTNPKCVPSYLPAAGGHVGRVHLSGGCWRLSIHRLQSVWRLQQRRDVQPGADGSQHRKHVSGVAVGLIDGPMWLQGPGGDPPALLRLPHQPLPQRGHLPGRTPGIQVGSGPIWGDVCNRFSLEVGGTDRVLRPVRFTSLWTRSTNLTANKSIFITSSRNSSDSLLICWRRWEISHVNWVSVSKASFSAVCSS